MATPARKRALKWFDERGTMDMRVTYADEPSPTMLVFMLADGHLDSVAGFYSLTDAGRRPLHEAK